MKKSLPKYSLAFITRILILIKSFIWIIFGIIYLVQLNNFYPPTASYIFIIVAMLIFGNAVAFFLIYLFLPRRKKLIYYSSLAYLFLNIVLAFTDQFGLADFLSLIIDIVIVILLIWKRQDFLPGKAHS